MKKTKLNIKQNTNLAAEDEQDGEDGEGDGGGEDEEQGVVKAYSLFFK